VRVVPAGAPRRGVTDRARLYAAAFLRAVATGMTGILLGVYLPRSGCSPAATGVIVAAGLAGGAVAMLLATLGADRFGRRRSLVLLALFAAAGGIAVAATSAPVLLGAAAFAGMLNGMGRDRGAALVLEQAILPGTVSDAARTRAFAWYNVVQDSGHALGSLCAVLPALLRSLAGLGELASLRVAIVATSALSLAALPFYLGLSDASEPEAGIRRARVSEGTRRVLTRISSLFVLDSLGGGFLTAALLSVYFFERFGAGEALLGPLFFGARVLNALSHLAAAWLARRIGLVATMVFTHIPSSLLLLTVPFAPTFPVAAALFLLREGLVEMDVPTRQSYVMALVRPEERTTASGVTQLVRTGAWAVAPAFAGALMQSVSMATPLVAGAGLKILYDLLLWKEFRAVRPPEER
ncbi:MAG TPA: MFS transporter, partial [Candidatus Polarisedimenticolaceae bacterium]|nr:MFS transporter [Candidatus Polarisedimenticolaceae bacterium]